MRGSNVVGSAHPLGSDDPEASVSHRHDDGSKLRGMGDEWRCRPLKIYDHARTQTFEGACGWRPTKDDRVVTCALAMTLTRRCGRCEAEEGDFSGSPH